MSLKRPRTSYKQKFTFTYNIGQNIWQAWFVKTETDLDIFNTGQNIWTKIKKIKKIWIEMEHFDICFCLILTANSEVLFLQ